MTGFKVGDIITGTERNFYGVTNSDAVMLVTGIEPTHDVMRVKILYGRRAGMQFIVDWSKIAFRLLIR